MKEGAVALTDQDWPLSRSSENCRETRTLAARVGKGEAASLARSPSSDFMGWPRWARKDLDFFACLVLR